MGVLIQGASVAGPVVAYWLARHGFDVTVVERAPALRKAGGHAVDLFRPAVEIAERMGVLDEVVARRTGTDVMTVHSTGAAPFEIDTRRLFGSLSDRHVEIMRDDLGEIFHDAGKDDVEYVFDNSITAIDGGRVSFRHGPDRHFDLVIGADGLHSRVRELVFGRVPEVHLGSHLAVASIPNYLDLDDRTLSYFEVGRMAAMYSAAHLPDARAVFLFRGPELDYHHRDVPRQKELLREAFAGAPGEVPTWLDRLDGTFYFDSITQLRTDTWAKGRVALVGDAAYCPGPAVGGSTSLAVVGAYVLAGAIAEAAGDPTVAYPAYHARMARYVRESRAAAVVNAKRLVPASAGGLRALRITAKAVTRLPKPISRLLMSVGTGKMRLHETVELPEHPSPVRG
ncbi:FAD-dependent monooxygenase [Actinosynnema sp. NPDC020468]|uniref:FAD-dependent monooxygenase n=1 Tax=Actinosynnema sp. NPDC020468 TaxID=3154488 RepID=UPI0033DB711D